MINKTSVITLVKDRETHLQNLIKGLENNVDKPEELVVIRMGEPTRSLSSSMFSIREIELEGEGGLPLASARNLGASTAEGDLLVYLDVDCIPVPYMLQCFKGTVERRGECIALGQVRYLPKDAIAPEWKGNTNEFWNIGSYNNSRPRIESEREEPNYNLFWSLAFALHKDTFEKTEGFDEAYVGWGGEDTDFAYKARAVEIPLWWSAATALHQYHEPSHSSEKYIQSIVDNANYFYSKWGTYPMLSFIQGFEQKGLVKLGSDGYIVL